MRKLALLLLILVVSFALAAGLEVSQRIRVVILPVKASYEWSEGDVDQLLTILESVMTELGRFEVYSRAHLKQIMEERGLAEMGITDTDAMELGKIAGARYVILLSLNSLDTRYRDGYYMATVRLSIRVLDITDGKVIATKPVDYTTSNIYDTDEEAKSAAFDYVASVLEEILREFFKLKASVARVEGGKAYLVGLDPALVKKGMIFEIKRGLGEAGYVKVVDVEDGKIVADVLYGPVVEGGEAKEYPMMGQGAIFLNIFLPSEDENVGAFGLSVAGWKDNVYLEVGWLAGAVAGLTIAKVDFGGRMEFLHMDRIFAAAHGGFSILGIYNVDYEEWIAALFGVFAGVEARYEFNPKSGVMGKVDYSYYAFGGVSGGLPEVSVGYYMGF